MISVDRVSLDPFFGVKFRRIRFVPSVTNLIVPFFKSISIWAQVCVFAPSFKLLDLIKT
jgi:hypothetical protein